MAYNFLYTASNLQHDALTLCTDSQDINAWLDFVGLSKHYRKDITGVIVLTFDGDLCAMWLSEDNAPYLLSAWYHPLPYYSQYAKRRNVPEYHKESCECYDPAKLGTICDRILATGR